MTSSTLDLPILDLRASIRPDSVNEGDRTVEVVWSTGARVRRNPFFREPFDEELSLKDGHVRLDRFNKGAPLLADHSTWSIRNQLGIIERAWLRNGEGRAVVRFSQREDVEPIWQDVRTGILRSVSIGYRVHKAEDVTPKGAEVRVLRAVDWEPWEISFVTVPADADAGTRQAPTTYPCELVHRAMPEPEVTTTATPAPQETQPTGGETRAATPPVAPATPAPSGPTPEQLREEGMRQERERAAAIRAQCARVGLSSEFTEGLVARGQSLDASRAAIIDEVARTRDDGSTPGAIRVDVGVTEDVRRREAVANALEHRLNPKTELTDAGRRFMGRSLIEMNRMLLEQRGINLDGHSKSYIAERSFQSSSDFPAILQNVGSKTLARFYDEAERTWDPLARLSNLPDFKEVSRVQLGGATKPAKVNENGEFKRGKVAEGKETWGLATYGNIVPFTRQLLINDDLGAFSRIMEMQARDIRELENDLIWALITTPHVMADGNSIFHTSRANTGTGVINVANVGAAREKMRKQKGLGGETRLNLRPSYLIVPAALETAAQQFLAQTTPATDANANPFKRLLTPIAEARLDDDSALKWYLAATPAAVDMIEYGYLEGEQGPQFSTREGFDVDGVEYKVRLDFGATVPDFRGFYRSTGA